jgi:ABC-type transporter Mla MlaB component
LACDGASSRASLTGSFERGSVWFLEKHLAELEGDVVLDCSDLEVIDPECVATLREFCRRAATEGRRIVLHAAASTREIVRSAGAPREGASSRGAIPTTPT